MDVSDVQSLIDLAQESVATGELSSSAFDNLTKWLTAEPYQEYRSAIAESILAGNWSELDDVFWMIIPFGTGGRRGRMHPFGSNAINDRTIGESAAGLANHVKSVVHSEHPLSCAIAYDSRHRSRHFAELCAGVMVANGFRVYFLDDYRATPQLSFLVRNANCDCGIMVTASHNPPSDNAVKVYWNQGGQILPPHDQHIIEQVHTGVDQIPFEDFDESVRAGQITICTEKNDQAYLDAVAACSQDGPRDLQILYSPLQGVGGLVIPKVLQTVGFEQVEVFPDHADPDPDFSNVVGHVANPENLEVFESLIDYAVTQGADIVLATDPDADRMGCAAPERLDPDSDWKVFNGNQLCALLAAYRMESLMEAGALTAASFQVTTLVTTTLLRRIADHYGVRTRDDLLVGFKWIAAAIDQGGAQNFIYGTEESHGFMIGDYCRDKDGAAACMLICELAAKLKQRGQTLFDYLQQLYATFGYHQESLLTVYMEGSSGMRRRKDLMDQLRFQSPAELGGLPVIAVRDYLTNQKTNAAGESSVLDGPTDNLLFFEFEDEGNHVAVRPSGTEPKIKFYTFTRVAAEDETDLEADKVRMTARIGAIEADLQRIVNGGE